MLHDDWYPGKFITGWFTWPFVAIDVITGDSTSKESNEYTEDNLFFSVIPIIIIVIILIILLILIKSFKKKRGK